MSRYYIVNMLEGTVTTTDDEGIARDFQMSEEFFVIDSVENLWLTEDRDKHIMQFEQNARQSSAFRPGKESAKPVRASLGANDQSAAVVQEHQPCVPFPIARV